MRFLRRAIAIAGCVSSALGAQTLSARADDPAWMAVRSGVGQAPAGVAGVGQVVDDVWVAQERTSDAVDAAITQGWDAVITEAPVLKSKPHLVRVPKPRAASRVWASEDVRSPLKTPHALSGIASYYWQGQQTASGEPFNKRDMTAAHPTLPFGTRVKVYCESTGRDVVVRINDRGPFKPGRVIDLSEAAAEVIGMQGRGLTPVRITVLSR